MDKHSVTLKSATRIVERILKTSKIGALGHVEAFGAMVLAEYCRHGVQVTIQVALHPELSIDINGATTSHPEALEALLESAENTAHLVRSSFDVLKVA